MAVTTRAALRRYAGNCPLRWGQLGALVQAGGESFGERRGGHGEGEPGGVQAGAVEPGADRVAGLEWQLVELSRFLPAGAAARHLERAGWLKANMEHVLRELGLVAAVAGSWEVVPHLVLDPDLLSPLLTDPPFDIIASADLMVWLRVNTPR